MRVSLSLPRRVQRFASVWNLCQSRTVELHLVRVIRAIVGRGTHLLNGNRYTHEVRWRRVEVEVAMSFVSE